MSRILVVDDDVGILTILRSLLKTEEHDVSTAERSDQALDQIKTTPFDLVISDMKIEPFDGLRLLKEIRQAAPQTEVLIITAHATIECALEAMRLGVFDFITKPFKIPDFLATVNRALESRRADVTGVRKELDFHYRFETVVAESKSMRKLCDQIAWVAPTQTPVLILGDPGTHKEMLARVVYEQSKSTQGGFLVFDCSATPAAQAAVELLGSAPASANDYPRHGLLEQADNATVFINHINRLDLSTQQQVLEVIKTQTVSRLGQAEKLPVKARWIAASSVALEPLIERGAFLEGLYRKFSSVILKIAPLRERPEDILPLAYHTIRYEFGLDADLISIDPEAQRLLERYTWPGNQTELEDVILQAMKKSKGQRITTGHFPGHLRAVVQSQPENEPATAKESEGSFRWAYLRGYLNSVEKEYLQSVLDKMGGDQQKAAQALKMTISELLKRLKG